MALRMRGSREGSQLLGCSCGQGFAGTHSWHCGLSWTTTVVLAILLLLAEVHPASCRHAVTAHCWGLGHILPLTARCMP